MGYAPAMNRLFLFTVALLGCVLLGGCSGAAAPEGADAVTTEGADAVTTEDADAETTEDAAPVTVLRDAITELEAKSEHDAASVKVQHILIAFEGTLGPKPVHRDKEQAEALAARLFMEIQGGADFDALVKEHTDDSHPGIYPMTKSSRRGMVQGFGDVGWRLEVGEVGVAPFDTAKSKFGWHIIKRLE